MRATFTERRSDGAFTVIELLIVMSIIVVLAGLVLMTSGYVQKKGARSRAETEIAAMSAALESYKADSGIYPTDVQKTEAVNPTASPVPNTASQFLYANLSGDADLDGNPENKSYMAFKPQNLKATDPTRPIGVGNLVFAIRDPFGNPYGYSTAKAVGAAFGFNPTFDLWSTAASEGSSSSDQSQWIKNW